MEEALQEPLSPRRGPAVSRRPRDLDARVAAVAAARRSACSASSSARVLSGSLRRRDRDVLARSRRLDAPGADRAGPPSRRRVARPRGALPGARPCSPPSMRSQLARPADDRDRMTRTQVLGAALLVLVAGAVFGRAAAGAATTRRSSSPDLAFAPPMPPRILARRAAAASVHLSAAADRSARTDVRGGPQPSRHDPFLRRRARHLDRASQPGCCSAGIRSAATCSRAAARRGTAFARRSRRVAVLLTLLIGTLAVRWPVSPAARLDTDDHRGRRLRHRAAGALRGRDVARRDAARARLGDRLLDDGGGDGAGDLAGAGPRRAGDRRRGAPARRTQKLRTRPGPGRCEFCYVTCCRRPPARSHCKDYCCFRPLFSPRATLSFLGLGFAEPSPSWG